jgi:hypothetical protein
MFLSVAAQQLTRTPPPSAAKIVEVVVVRKTRWTPSTSHQDTAEIHSCARVCAQADAAAIHHLRSPLVLVVGNLRHTNALMHDLHAAQLSASRRPCLSVESLARKQVYSSMARSLRQICQSSAWPKVLRDFGGLDRRLGYRTDQTRILPHHGTWNEKKTISALQKREEVDRVRIKRPAPIQ